MPSHAMILQKVLNTPLLAHPDQAEIVAGVVLRQANIDVTIETDFRVPAKAGPVQEDRMRQGFEAHGVRPFLFSPEHGIAVIEVTGSLAHRQWHIGKSSGVMGYDGIGAQLDAALEDREVRGIIFDIHTAGGEVSGAFQLGDRIFAGRSVKPILAISDEMAFSAGYVLAAACEEVWLASDTAQVGSIGVVMMHFSFEKALEKDGVKPTIIHAGAHKADGNPFEDLPEETAARFQEKIEAVHDIFVGRVARWRGLSESAVRSTEADVFMGADAMAARLADGILSPADVIDALSSSTKGALAAF